MPENDPEQLRDNFRGLLDEETAGTTADGSYLTEDQILRNIPTPDSGHIRDLKLEMLDVDEADEYDVVAYMLAAQAFNIVAEQYSLSLQTAYIRATQSGLIKAEDVDAERREDLRELSEKFAEVGRFMALNLRGI